MLRKGSKDQDVIVYATVYIRAENQADWLDNQDYFSHYLSIPYEVFRAQDMNCVQDLLNKALDRVPLVVAQQEQRINYNTLREDVSYRGNWQGWYLAYYSVKMKIPKKDLASKKEVLAQRKENPSFWSDNSNEFDILTKNDQGIFGIYPGTLIKKEQIISVKLIKQGVSHEISLHPTPPQAKEIPANEIAVFKLNGHMHYMTAYMTSTERMTAEVCSQDFLSSLERNLSQLRRGESAKYDFSRKNEPYVNDEIKPLITALIKKGHIQELYVFPAKIFFGIDSANELCAYIVFLRWMLNQNTQSPMLGFPAEILSYILKLTERFLAPPYTGVSLYDYCSLSSAIQSAEPAPLALTSMPSCDVSNVAGKEKDREPVEVIASALPAPSVAQHGIFQSSPLTAKRIQQQCLDALHDYLLIEARKEERNQTIIEAIQKLMSNLMNPKQAQSLTGAEQSIIHEAAFKPIMNQYDCCKTWLPQQTSERRPGGI